MTINDKNIIKISVPNTRFWILGEKIDKNLWNTYLIDPVNPNYKELKRKTSQQKHSQYYQP